MTGQGTDQQPTSTPPLATAPGGGTTSPSGSMAPSNDTHPPSSGSTTDAPPTLPTTNSTQVATAPTDMGSGATPGMDMMPGSGAVPNTGGMNGAGAMPNVEPPPVTGELGCTGAELLCEDFESVADGQVPAGPWQPLDDSCQFQASSFTMGVTSQLANGGSKSLEITNKHFPQCRLSAAFDQVDEFWVRSYMYWEPELDTSNRETLAMDLTPGHRTADDPALRFGYRSKDPCIEYAGPQITIIGIGGGESTGCASRELPRGQWYCFEAHVQQTGVLSVRTYINGEALTYQSEGKPLVERVETESSITEKIDHVRLGLFSTGEAQGKVYVDDVVVSTNRVGCAD